MARVFHEDVARDAGGASVRWAVNLSISEVWRNENGGSVVKLQAENVVVAEYQRAIDCARGLGVVPAAWTFAVAEPSDEAFAVESTP